MYCPHNLYSKRRAFTLIELLVVIAIIGILAAILFPVFAQAKAAAKKSVCISNIKQISLSYLMYLNDYDDMSPSDAFGYPGNVNLSPPAQYASYGPVNYINTWWFGQFWYAENGVFSVNTNGYLYPYMKNGDIEECPSVADITNPYLGGVITGYGLNEATENVSYTATDEPSETIYMADEALCCYGANLPNPPFEAGEGPDITPWYYYGNGAIQGRHTGTTASVAWMDGHAKAMKVQVATFGVGPYQPLAGLQEFSLGQVMKYPRQCTESIYDSPDCGSSNPNAALDDYWYYQVTKPPAP